jgi:hypothetical protein
MKRLALTATALALLSGLAIAVPAQAATYKRHGSISHSERVAIANSQRHLNAVKRQAWADGKVTAWERAKIRMAEARYHRVVRNARHD